jgi:hypothetical protein
MESNMLWLVVIAIWLLFPLRVLLDRSMPRNERLAWALVCAVLPIAGYILFLIMRAVRISFARPQA